MPEGFIAYQIAASACETHLFEITIRLNRPSHKNQQPDPIFLKLPNWIPGSYLVRHFAKFIQDVKASQDGRPLKIQKINKNKWKIEPSSGAIQIHYRFYANDLSVRGAHLDDTHAYFNGAVLFLACADQSDWPCSLEILPMHFSQTPSPRVATGLEPDHISSNGFGRYRAPNYHALIDHPVEIGAFEDHHFEACGIPHRLVISDLPPLWPLDRERLNADVQKICETHLRFFGAPYPIQQYCFLLRTQRTGYGGLEHKNSTSLMCAFSDLPLLTEKEIRRSDYIRLLGLFSHEYFHTWNVKRIRPEAFATGDLDQENYTQDLWIYEGITSYYDDLALVRSGMISTQDYLKLIGETWTRLYRTPGRLVQSLHDSSFDTWIKFYQPHENSINAEVSYYNKGAIVAMMTDLRIRALTQHEKSLDDVMKSVWSGYGQMDKPLPEAHFCAIVEALIPSDSWPTFWAMTLQEPVEFKEELLRSLWSEVGLSIQFRSQESLQDNGGTPSNAPRGHRLGVTGSLTPEGYRVKQVFSGSAAEKGGIAPGDILIAMNKRKIDSEDLDQHWRSESNPPPIVEFYLFRRDRLITRTIIPQLAPLDTVYFEIDPKGSHETTRRRDNWLRQQD